jgi:hypothetical protein
MTDHSSFGPELRRAREARGLTLEEIAEVTKVNVALFRGLENNDLSRWPSGLFRRSFIRSYASTVGLDPEETCRRFVRLFPEEGDAVPEMRAVPPPPVVPVTPLEEAEPPRLVLAAVPPSSSSGTSTSSRVAAALADLGLGVLMAGVAGALAVALAGPGWFWPAAAGAAAVGHLLALALLGRTPGAWWLLRERPLVKTEGGAPEPARRTGPEGPVLVASRREPARPAATTRSTTRRQGRR